MKTIDSSYSLINIDVQRKRKVFLECANTYQCSASFLLILDTYILPEAWEKRFFEFYKTSCDNYMNYLYTVLEIS